MLPPTKLMLFFALFLEDLDLYFLPVLHQTDCCPGCTNVQTVSPLHLNPYGINVKGILSSDYSFNLLNNVLLPSFSAAAETPPSLMTQPLTRTNVPFPLSLSPFPCIVLTGVRFSIQPDPVKEDRVYLSETGVLFMC